MDYSKEQGELYLMQQTSAMLMSVALKLDKKSKKDFKGLSSRQYLVILTILHLPQGQASMGNIAKKLGTSKQNINQLLNAVKKKGYINISGNENDKRAFNIDVTESGMKALFEHSERGIAFLSEIFQDFSADELSVLLRLLSKLHKYDGIDYFNIEDAANKIFVDNYPE